ncbi:hypothetical protein ACQR3P_28705 [Rhodococcus sp. IEGM1300]
MSKKFIVKTPFGIGVATSEEDLKGLLSFVEGITDQEEGDASDCPRCQAEADYNGQGLPDEIHEMMDAISEKIANEDGEILSFEQYVNRFMSELSSELKASKGEPVSGDERSESKSTPSMKDILEMIFGEQEPQQGEAPEEKPQQEERVVAGYGVKTTRREQTPLTTGDPLEQLSSWISSGTVPPSIKASLEKERARFAEDNLTEEDLLERLSIDIDWINSMHSNSMLDSFRDYLTSLPGETSSHRDREIEILVGKVDEKKASLSKNSVTEDDTNSWNEPTLEEINQMTDIEEIDRAHIALSSKSDALAEETSILNKLISKTERKLDALANQKAVITAGNAGEARAKVRDQFTALESVLNDASMKTSVSDEVFKEVARLKEKFSL